MGAELGLELDDASLSTAPAGGVTLDRLDDRALSGVGVDDSAVDVTGSASGAIPETGAADGLAAHASAARHKNAEAFAAWILASISTSGSRFLAPNLEGASGAVSAMASELLSARGVTAGVASVGVGDPCRVSEGGLIVSKQSIGPSPEIKCLDVIRLQAQGKCKIGRGPVNFSEVEQAAPSEVAAIAVIRVQGQDLGEFVRRLLPNAPGKQVLRGLDSRLDLI